MRNILPIDGPKKKAAILAGRFLNQICKTYLGAGVVVSVVPFLDFLPPLWDLLVLLDFLVVLVEAVEVLVLLWSPLDPVVP